MIRILLFYFILMQTLFAIEYPISSNSEYIFQVDVKEGEKLNRNLDQYKKIDNIRKFLRQTYKTNRWIHFELNNVSKKDLKKTFSFRWLNADLELYLFEKNRLLKKTKLIDINQNGIFKYDFTIKKNQNIDVFIYHKVDKNNDEFSYLDIVNEKDYMKNMIWYESLFGRGLFLGFLVIIFIHSIFSFITLKKRYNLYFAFFLLSLILLVSDDFRKLVYTYLNEYAFFILKSLIPMSFFIFSTLFSKNFLNLKEEFPIINRIANLLIIYFLIVLFGKVLSPSSVYYSYLIGSLFLVFLYAGYKKFMKGDGSAFYYTLGHFAFVVFLFFNTLNSLGYRTMDYLPNVLIFTSINAFFFMIAIQHKIRNLYIEKEKITLQTMEDKKIIYMQSKLAAMGEMIGNIAHQWRQPLNSISLLVANIQMRKNTGKLDDEIFDKKINQINDQLDFMSNTIEDFRNFFIQSDEKKSSIILGEVCDEAISLLQGRINTNKIILERRYNNSTVISKKAELIQVLLILINNSIDAFKINEVQNKKLIITTKNNTISIWDNAGGIPLDIHDKIFEPYFTTKDKKVGTGLGLYMTKLIAENHIQADINFTSLNKTTTFNIVFTH